MTGVTLAKNYYDIALALAGICQSAYLVQKLAHQGNCPTDALKTSLQSMMDLNPPSTLAVYGNDEANLRAGLESLLGILNNGTRHGAGAELTLYTLSMILLERKLSANKNALAALSQRIVQLDRQLVHYDLDSNTLLSAMAAIYVDVISPLGPRIQVAGSAAVLQNTQIQSKVRATLLTGIRSAMLWRQVGGSRLLLMFSRNRLASEAKQMLSRITESSL